MAEAGKFQITMNGKPVEVPENYALMPSFKELVERGLVDKKELEWFADMEKQVEAIESKPDWLPPPLEAPHPTDPLGFDGNGHWDMNGMWNAGVATEKDWPKDKPESPHGGVGGKLAGYQGVTYGSGFSGTIMFRNHDLDQPLGDCEYLTSPVTRHLEMLVDLCGGVEDDQCCRRVARAVIEAVAVEENKRVSHRYVSLMNEAERDVNQILAQGIGSFPWFKDDQANCPGATDKDGVDIGTYNTPKLAKLAVELLEAMRLRMGETMYQELLSTVRLAKDIE